MPNYAIQALSLVGAAMVLFAYIATALNKMNPKGLPYGILNCVGTAMIAVTALFPLNLGVLLLEGIWSVVSLILCVKALSGTG